MTTATITSRPGRAKMRHRSKVRLGDALASGTHGLRSRRGRAALTAVGIAIGIASMIAVLGISSSSKAALIAQIDELGTDLLRIQAASNVFGESSALPADAPGMVRRVGPVENASATTSLNASVRKNSWDRSENGLTPVAAEPQLLDTLEADMRVGRFLEEGTAAVPTAVLGSVAAERLGIVDLDGAPTIDIAGRSFAVVGILETMALAPDLDRSVLISTRSATDILGAKIVPVDIYVRVAPEQVEQVRTVLARTANPAAPNEVAVSRPSDALEARAQVDQNLQTMLLGLAGVALLVGGVGIANVMVMSVLERRSEIGLRRALGATRRHIAVQFVLEAVSLSTIGGLLGVAIGAAVTVLYAQQQGWLVAIPVAGLALGVAAALTLGALAGLYPAIRAARLDPAEAVRPAG
jgi:putative ABC transport system permease protein